MLRKTPPAHKDKRRNNRLHKINRAGRPAHRNKPSPRHMKVIDYYFSDECNFVKSAAMRLAGYSESMCRTGTSHVFDRPEVVAEIERRHAERKAQYKLSEQWVVERLMRIGGANFGNIIVKLQQSNGDLTALSHDERYALAEFTQEIYTEGRGEFAEKVKRTKVKPKDAVAALNSLARIGGFNKDKVDVSGEVNLVERLQKGRERVAKLREGNTDAKPSE